MASEFVNLEAELYREVLKNTKRELRPEECLLMFDRVSDVQHKIEITKEIEAMKERNNGK